MDATLDLHGRTVEEALADLEAFLDRCYYEGHRVVEVVHGKGTGRVRKAVREALAEHPFVVRYETNGNPGATRVVLAL